MPTEDSMRKVAIIGSGTIGTALAYALGLRLQEDTELVLVNRNEKKSWAKAFDLSHCEPELRGPSFHSSPIAEVEGADVIVLTVGTLPKENGTRLDVLRANLEIYSQLLPPLARGNPDASLLVITNPVDAMAYGTLRLSGFPEDRVLGSGTELDAQRLRLFSARDLDLDPRLLHIPVVGEHGDSMVPLWSLATYGNHPLAELGSGITDTLKADLLHRTKRAGWEIRQAGEHSSFGIALTAARIVQAILNGSGEPLLVSALTQRVGVGRSSFVSLPTMLGPQGIVERRMPVMDDEEAEALQASMAVVSGQMDEVDRMVKQLPIRSG